MPLAAWFIALGAPVVRQILISLGIGITTFVGLDLAVSGLISSAATSINALPIQAAQLFGLAGGFQALSIVAGGLTFRVSMIALKSFKLL